LPLGLSNHDSRNRLSVSTYFDLEQKLILITGI